MDYFVGFIFGFLIGVGLIYYRQHRSEIAFSLSRIKTDMAAIRAKLDEVIKK